MTWNTLTYFYAGQQLTATNWNQYVGDSGNIAYLRNNYWQNYYASFIGSTTVNASTITEMRLGSRNGNSATFTIPSSWGSGMYYYEAIVSPTTTETNTGARYLQPVINGIGSAFNNMPPTVTTIKGTYEYKGLASLAPGITIKFNFFQSTAANTSFDIFFIIQRVSL